MVSSRARFEDVAVLQALLVLSVVTITLKSCGGLLEKTSNLVFLISCSIVLYIWGLRWTALNENFGYFRY